MSTFFVVLPDPVQMGRGSLSSIGKEGSSRYRLSRGKAPASLWVVYLPPIPPHTSSSSSSSPAWSVSVVVGRRGLQTNLALLCTKRSHYRRIVLPCKDNLLHMESTVSCFPREITFWISNYLYDNYFNRMIVKYYIEEESNHVYNNKLARQG